jgi:hypothetical protein
MQEGAMPTVLDNDRNAFVAAMVPKTLAGRLKTEARRADRPVSFVIRQALHAYLLGQELR